MGNQLGKSVFKNDESIRIVMLGTAGSGKSATGNTILGKHCFKSKDSSTSSTQHCEKAVGVISGHMVTVIDTPGLFDTKNTEEETVKYIAQMILPDVSPGPHIFLIIIKLGVFTEEEKQTVQKIQKIFGEEVYKYSIVLFTHGHQLKGKSGEEFLKHSIDLQELVGKCNNQYHVINNKSHFQRKGLLEKIKKIKEQNKGDYYSTIQNAAFRPPTAYNNDDLIRIVMVGKTGAGKSATGNTIVGEKCFKSELSAKPLTLACDKAIGEVDRQWVAVIDTPSLFDNITEKETAKHIVQCIAYASPGPHIFLVVIKVDRFTEEEKKTVQKIQKVFGEGADKYSMVLFTHGDRLKGKPMDKFLEESEDLQELLAKCHGQYHVFNNEEEEDRSQVSELLKKIKKINDQNGRSFDTTELLQKAERVIEEEKQ